MELCIYTQVCNKSMYLTQKSIQTTLSQLQIGKSKGPYAISNIVFERTALSTNESQHLNYKIILNKSILPLKMERNEMAPIFKSVINQPVENFEPINLLCCEAKLLES